MPLSAARAESRTASGLGLHEQPDSGNFRTSSMTVDRPPLAVCDHEANHGGPPRWYNHCRGVLLPCKRGKKAAVQAIEAVRRDTGKASMPICIPKRVH